MRGEEKTLRDEFATMALSAALSRPITAADRNGAIRNMGREAYAIADAMLAARALGQGGGE